jgi:hypothetical protein
MQRNNTAVLIKDLREMAIDYSHKCERFGQIIVLLSLFNPQVILNFIPLKEYYQHNLSLKPFLPAKASIPTITWTSDYRDSWLKVFYFFPNTIH